jgi:phosphatidylethanolamine/phosphatidyl-N-methylethanolamine N-methyltransferase
MSQWWHETSTFWRQYRTNFKHTGAVLPSGNALGRALTTFVRKRESTPGANGAGLRILEVGPGTGAVTRHLCAGLQSEDRLDLVELNSAFVDVLRRRLAEESPFCDVAARVAVHHRPVEELPIDAPYDLIISGLPLNNFEVPEVEHILGLFSRLLKPTGTLSFFEYIGIRKLRALVSNRNGRTRLQGIGRALDGLLRNGEVHRDHIWVNVPPAYVHHVRFVRR